MAGYNATSPPEAYRENLTSRGFTVETLDTDLRGIDPWGRNFSFVSSGVPTHRYLMDFPADRAVSAHGSRFFMDEAEEAWNASEDDFLHSVTAFEDATGLRHDFYGWQPLALAADWVCAPTP